MRTHEAQKRRSMENLNFVNFLFWDYRTDKGIILPLEYVLLRVSML